MEDLKALILVAFVCMIGGFVLGYKYCKSRYLYEEKIED